MQLSLFIQLIIFYNNSWPEDTQANNHKLEALHKYNKSTEYFSLQNYVQQMSIITHNLALITVTDLHIYILDTVPPIHFVWNYVATDKLITANGGTFTSSSANHVKARWSLIQWSVMWLATESGWARSKRSAIWSGQLCGGFITFGQCCPRDLSAFTTNNSVDIY